MEIKEFYSLKEIQQYYDERANTYIFKLNNDEYINKVVFNFDLDVKANIDANNIKAKDISANDITAWNINAYDIHAIDIKADVIEANNIIAHDIVANDVYAKYIGYNIE